MKKFAVIAALMFAMAAGTVRAGEVTTPSGAVQVNAAIKWLYSYSCKDEDTRYPGRDRFSTTLADLEISGDLNDIVGYRIEIASSWDQDFQTGTLGVFSTPDETGTAGIRQASIRIGNIVKWASLEVGTFMPPITNYQPRAVTDLDTILYPLMNAAPFYDTGMFGNRPATGMMGSWQQTGFNLNIQMPYNVAIDFGMWNGMGPNWMAQPNNELAKATSIVVTFKPTDRHTFAMAMWGEDFEWRVPPPISTNVNRSLTVIYMWASYKTDVLELTADYAQANIPDGALETTGDFRELTWEGYQITAGYWLRSDFEILGRYEYFDPATQDAVKLPSSRYDKSWWTTLGLTYTINDWAEVSLNYIFKKEEGDFIEKGKAGRDPYLPNYDPKYNAQKNNLLLIEVQVWQ